MKPTQITKLTGHQMFYIGLALTSVPMMMVTGVTLLSILNIFDGLGGIILAIILMPIMVIVGSVCLIVGLIKITVGLRRIRGEKISGRVASESSRFSSDFKRIMLVILVLVLSSPVLLMVWLLSA